jgi:BioD-like phosphotransacetylase family protein
LTALYITSLYDDAGKTTLCAGLGRYLQGRGKKVGYLKPVVTETKAGDTDAAFLKAVLTLAEPVGSLAPAIPPGELAARLNKAYEEVAAGKDLVLVEGSSLGIVEALDARVIVVEPYSDKLASPEFLGRAFGKYLLGVVVNKVPASRMKTVAGYLNAAFGKAMINVLGLLPDDRVMVGLTVAQLTECVQGQVLNSPDNTGEVVENYMLGAMVLDSGLTYYGRKANKAAIIRGERADMQLAALETATRCLVLTGGVSPIYAVLNQARNKGIPVVLTGTDTLTAMGRIEEALSRQSFRQERKMPRLGRLLEQGFNYAAVNQGLGLAD